MKMKSDYTLYNQSSIQNYSSIDNVDQAVEYLKDPTHFRSFGQGLTELLQKKNAPVDFSDNDVLVYRKSPPKSRGRKPP